MFPEKLEDCTNEIKKEIRTFQDETIKLVETEGAYVWFLAPKLTVLVSGNDKKETEKLMKEKKSLL